MGGWRSAVNGLSAAPVTAGPAGVLGLGIRSFAAVTRSQRRAPAIDTPAKPAHFGALGPMAEWLRRGLQILARRFDSGSGLQPHPGRPAPPDALRAPGE